MDSVAGGMPSPVLSGRPVPLPIPAGHWPAPDATTYATVGLGPLVERLSNGRLPAATPCHLDPDVDRARLPRAPGWRGAFGQCAAAQGHLDRHGVGPGDLFLFFGLYRDAEEKETAAGGTRFRGPRHHLIYGWLQVAEILRAGDPFPAWLAYHPHARGDWPANNTVYVAREHLSFAPDLPGYGVLPLGHRLTAEAAPNPSLWRVPAWLDPTAGGAGMTFHRPEWWLGDGLLRASGRGQEFVADVGDRATAAGALAWVAEALRAGGA